MRRYFFPFSEVKEGSRVIIYGAGGVGRQYISEILGLGGVEILCVIDQSGYYTYMKMHSVKVCDPSFMNQLSEEDYDYVVIANAIEDEAKIMKDNLIAVGVPENKIVYKITYVDDINSFANPAVSKWMKPSFSFFGEDIIIKNIFTLIGLESPSYLDVGCNHPYNGNNTALLYMSGSNGWNIDASRKCIELMTKERPDDINICCGVSTEEGEKDFYILGETNMLNSFSEDYMKFYVETYIDKNGVNAKCEKIDCYTLKTIIDKYCDGIFPDFLDLDIEGMDEKVIASYDFSINGPKVICVETHSPLVVDQLSGQGYSYMMSTTHNSIFVKSEYAIGDAYLYLQIDKALDNLIINENETICNDKTIVIYGCGKVGRYVFKRLTCGDKVYPIEGFMVRDKNDNPDFWMGKPVKNIGEYATDACSIIVSLANRTNTGVEQDLKEAGYKDVILLDIM